jgi:hypothetical protein
LARNRYLTRQGFRRWLESEGAIQVGLTRDIHECPVANYLNSLTMREWHTSALACVPQVRAEVEDHEFRTPKWAQRFIHNLDKHFGRKPTPVSGDDALYILEEYS